MSTENDQQILAFTTSIVCAAISANRLAAEALSHTGAMKVDRQRLNMEISKWATDSDLHITIGDVEALHEAVLSALEPAAPEPKTLVHEPMVWTGRGPYGMSPAAPDNKTAVGYEPFTLFPDGSYERVQEGFGYRDENGQPQFQQTVPASEQAARRPSGKSPDDYRTDYEIGLDNGYALARPAEQAVTDEMVDKAVVEAIHALRVEQPGRAYDILSRSALVKVVVFQWPCGTPARHRSPRGDRSRRRAIFVDKPASSMKTSFAGSRSSRPSNQARRRFRTSRRSCSGACANFFGMSRRAREASRSRRSGRCASTTPPQDAPPSRSA